jgi:nucleotide-binding universal stress UspA family protein
MVDALLANPVVPVASEEDARETIAALLPHLTRDGGRFVAVHVIEKAGGAPDKASVEQLEERSQQIFDLVESLAAEAGVAVEADLRYNTDIVEGVFEAATDHDATAVVYTPREGSRWLDILTGDVTRNLIKRANRPVVALPGGHDTTGATTEADATHPDVTGTTDTTDE